MMENERTSLLDSRRLRSVLIFVWNPTDITSPGHVSMQLFNADGQKIRGGYVSAWPSEDETGVEFIASYIEELSSTEHRPPDVIFRIQNINTAAMLAAFNKLKIRARWRLSGSGICRNPGKSVNCSGLVLQILVAGGLKKHFSYSLEIALERYKHPKAPDELPSDELVEATRDGEKQDKIKQILDSAHQGFNLTGASNLLKLFCSIGMLGLLVYLIYKAIACMLEKANDESSETSSACSIVDVIFYCYLPVFGVVVSSIIYSCVSRLKNAMGITPQDIRTLFKFLVEHEAARDNVCSIDEVPEIMRDVSFQDEPLHLLSAYEDEAGILEFFNADKIKPAIKHVIDLYLQNRPGDESLFSKREPKERALVNRISRCLEQLLDDSATESLALIDAIYYTHNPYLTDQIQRDVFKEMIIQGVFTEKAVTQLRVKDENTELTNTRKATLFIIVQSDLKKSAGMKKSESRSARLARSRMLHDESEELVFERMSYHGSQKAEPASARVELV